MAYTQELLPANARCIDSKSSCWTHSSRLASSGSVFGDYNDHGVQLRIRAEHAPRCVAIDSFVWIDAALEMSMDIALNHIAKTRHHRSDRQLVQQSRRRPDHVWHPFSQDAQIAGHERRIIERSSGSNLHLHKWQYGLGRGIDGGIVVEAAIRLERTLERDGVQTFRGNAVAQRRGQGLVQNAPSR